MFNSMTKKSIKAMSENEIVKKLDRVIEYIEEEYPNGLHSCEELENGKDYARAVIDFVNLTEELDKLNKEE